MAQFVRLFLDTNVYILGATLPDSAEAKILAAVGFGHNQPADVKVIVSPALIAQIRRVARRLRNKDWAGELLAQMMQGGMQLHFVLLDEREIGRLQLENLIPREDIEIYLSAKTGRVDVFVSANHKLIRALATYTGAFTCLTPEEYVAAHLESE